MLKSGKEKKATMSEENRVSKCESWILVIVGCNLEASRVGKKGRETERGKRRIKIKRPPWGSNPRPRG